MGDFGKVSVGTNLHKPKVCLNTCIPTVYKDIWPLSLHPVQRYLYVNIHTFRSTDMCFLDIPSGVAPRWALSRWKGSSISGKGEVVLEVVGQLGGGGSNGSRNRPCSAAPGSLIMLSAVNVFGVRDWYPIPPLSAAAWPWNNGQTPLPLPLALPSLSLCLSLPFTPFPSAVWKLRCVRVCANVLSPHVGISAPLIACICVTTADGQLWLSLNGWSSLMCRDTTAWPYQCKITLSHSVLDTHKQIQRYMHT